MSFRTRSYKKELLDRDDIPFADIRRNMQELNTINTLLGGHAITCKGLARLLPATHAARPLTIAEIGCGGGDNLAAIKQFLQKKGIPFLLTGIDIKPECIAYAQQVHAADRSFEWICSDYRDVHWEQHPDIIFSSLFCHHFTDEELAAQLQWMYRNSIAGFFINDLHRHPLAYHSIRIMTRLFSKSYLVKNDAPLSVMRGFKKADWEKILTTAGVKEYDITWQWAFRYLVSVKK